MWFAMLVGNFFFSFGEMPRRDDDGVDGVFFGGVSEDDVPRGNLRHPSCQCGGWMDGWSDGLFVFDSSICLVAQQRIDHRRLACLNIIVTQTCPKQRTQPPRPRQPPNQL